MSSPQQQQQSPSISSVLASMGQQVPGTASAEGRILDALENLIAITDNILGELFHKVLDTLTIPDMLSIMSGNWVPLQGLHPMLKSYLIEDLLEKDESMDSQEQLCDEIVDSLKSTLNENDLPQVLNTDCFLLLNGPSRTSRAESNQDIRSLHLLFM